VSVKTPTNPSVAVPPTGSRSGTIGKAVAGLNSGSSSSSSSSPSSAGSGASRSAAAAGANSGQSAPGDASTSYGQGPFAGLPTGAGAPGVTRHISRRDRARLAREQSLKETVARLQGCLGELPERSRELLELRTGIGPSRPLDPRAVAARLHLGVARLPALERKAVAQLRKTARTHGCARMTQAVAQVLAFIGAGFAGQDGGARGGVEAVRFTASPSKLSAGERAGSSSHVGLFGAGLPPAASDAILVLILLLAGAISVVAVVADSAGQGPRHWQWRRRIINRLPWLR
jgi:hypothetical protein